MSGDVANSSPDERSSKRERQANVDCVCAIKLEMKVSSSCQLFPRKLSVAFAGCACLGYIRAQSFAQFARLNWADALRTNAMSFLSSAATSVCFREVAFSMASTPERAMQVTRALKAQQCSFWARLPYGIFSARAKRIYTKN